MPRSVFDYATVSLRSSDTVVQPAQSTLLGRKAGVVTQGFRQIDVPMAIVIDVPGIIDSTSVF